MYAQGSDHLIQSNTIYNHTGYGIHVFSGYANGAHRTQVLDNHVYGNSTAASASAGILLASGSDHVAARNLVRGQPFGLMASDSATNPKFYNNTVYGATTAGAHMKSGVTGAILRNNLFYNNVYTANNGIQLASTNPPTITQSNNSTANPDYIDAANNNFGLLSTSTSIDAGTQTGISGITTWNGNNPDRGAFETFTCSAVVPDTASDNTIVITCDNNQAPPLLPAADCSGFTARKNLVGNAVNTCARTADNKITLTLTNSYINTDTADWSYTTGTGNVSNSALIGNVLNQRLNAVTNQSATNRVGGSVPALTQVSSWFERPGGTEAAQNFKGALNTGITIPPGACVRWRPLLRNTVANFGTSGYTVFFQKNGSGGYAAVPNGPTPVAGLSFVTGTGRTFPELPVVPTTDQMAGAGTFVPGSVILSALETPNITLAAGEDTELVFGLCAGTGHVDGDYFDLRTYSAGGVALSSYTQTGRITINSTAYTAHFGAR